MHRPFVVLFQQDSAYEAEDGGFVGEDPDDIGAPLDLAIEALDGIVRVDLGPVVFREGGVSEDILFGFIQQVSEFLHLWPQLIGDPSPLGLHRFGVFLGEGRADEGADHAFATPGGVGQRVAHEVDAATLPRGVHDLGDRRLDAQMGVGDHELDAAQPAKGQLSQEAGPECFGFRSANVHAQHLAPPVCVHAHRDDHGDRCDAMILPHLHIGGVDPDIGPFALDGPLQEGVHPLVDLLAEPGDLALGHTRHAHGLDEVIDGAGRDALDIGLLNDRRQRLLAHAPGLQKPREV